MVGEQIEKREKEHWTRHPMILAVFAFLLTGVVGATLTYFYSRLNTEEEHSLARVAARRDAIMANHKALLEFSGAAEHLMVLLDTQDPSRESLSEAFKTYQEAAAHARSAVDGMMFLTFERTYGKPEGKNSAEIARIIDDLVDWRIRPLLIFSDSCVINQYRLAAAQSIVATHRCDDSEVTKDFPQVPRLVNERIDSYANCARTFTLIELIIGTDPREQLWKGEDARAPLLTRIRALIDDNCPSLGVTPPKQMF